MRIGFIGLGRMGMAMATNLVMAGHDVTGSSHRTTAAAADWHAWPEPHRQAARRRLWQIPKPH
jgi:3-hydroxyisobutyrate dehydrogenase-like beta-hydroxyacid dehydrogenase